jgi:hypothetical protein
MRTSRAAGLGGDGEAAGCAGRHGTCAGVGRAGPRHPLLTEGVAVQLRVVEDIIQIVGIIHGLCRVISRQDPDLSKQMKRAINSLGLNAGEGLSARGVIAPCASRAR